MLLVAIKIYMFSNPPVYLSVNASMTVLFGGLRLYFASGVTNRSKLVVQWSMILLMMILSLILGLVIEQVYIKSAFMYAFIVEGEDIYVEIPRGL